MKEAPDRPHALYRFFGADGALLYIGITWNIATRFPRHQGGKPWWCEVNSIKVEQHPDRASVLRAERAAIEAERPRYNINHNSGRPQGVSSEAMTGNRRLTDDPVLTPGSLVGSYFHGRGSGRSWQGCIVAEPSPGVYLIELFDWMGGYPFNQELIRLEEMIADNWFFYDSAEWMTEFYEHHRELVFPEKPKEEPGRAGTEPGQ